MNSGSKVLNKTQTNSVPQNIRESALIMQDLLKEFSDGLIVEKSVNTIIHSMSSSALMPC